MMNLIRWINSTRIDDVDGMDAEDWVEVCLFRRRLWTGLCGGWLGEKENQHVWSIIGGNIVWITILPLIVEIISELQRG